METEISGPIYRIHTPRLVIRCWEPADAPALKVAIDASIAHLLPWMPWAKHEPQKIDEKVEMLRRFRGMFDLGQDFIYGIFDHKEQHVLGGSGLHLRQGPGSREIGYWIHADHIGRGIATETSAALTRVAFEVDRVTRVEIRCDPENVRSAAIPARLGYTHEATRRRLPIGMDGAERDAMIWTLFADEYPGTLSASAQIDAFDAAGRNVLG